MTEHERIAGAVQAIRDRIGDRRPHLGLVLGSGLGPVAQAVEDPITIPYSDIPGFPRPSVSGHGGSLLSGRFGGADVIVFQGRKHLYEGEGFGAMALAIRTVKALGAGTVILTCAAGSLNADVGPGRLMMITDHINMLGTSPLVGPNDDGIGPRFVNLVDAWDPELRARLEMVAGRQRIALARGVYCAWLGPAFETPAEIRMMRTMGADAVGMSTVPECLIARHCGLRVAGIAVITNLAAGMTGAPLSHDETLENAGATADAMRRLLWGFVDDVTKESADASA